MHVSRAEDLGGNKIQVNYEGKGTNLHSIWDSRLIEHSGLNAEKLANQVDHASPKQIKQLQNDPLLDWLWESYQISSQLYGEVVAMKSRAISEDYYKSHISIIEDRLEKAGIRLAGVLNQIFENGTFIGQVIPPPTAASIQNQTAKTIEIQTAAQHIDENVSICSQVYGYKEFGSMTLVNIGVAYPNQLPTVVLKGAAKDLTKEIDGKKVCITGQLESYKGKPQIIVINPKSIKLIDEL